MQLAAQSTYMARKKTAGISLVEAVRIVSIFQPNDAITLDMEFFSNSNYFFDIMKLVDENFLIRDYK